MSEVTVTRDDRRPTIQLYRKECLEPRIRLVLYWNGTIAPNGDGIPGGEADVDYDTPLNGYTVDRRSGARLPGQPLFLIGQQRLAFGGRYGRGAYGRIGASRSATGGYGGGPYGGGAYGVGASFYTWRFPFPLRDGDYRIAALYADELGNVQDPPGTILVLTVAAVPRPPLDLRVTSDGVTLAASWTHSPEFAATA